MPNFKTVEELNSYIKKMAKQALRDDVARRVYSIMNKYILEEVYNKYSPEEYERTYALLHSLTVGEVVETKNTLSIKIFIPNEMLGHTTWWGSESLGYESGDQVPVSAVATWLEEGYTWGRPSSDFMQKSIDELRVALGHVKGFIGYLQSKGINVK